MSARRAAFALLTLIAGPALGAQGLGPEGDRAAQQRIDAIVRDFDRRGLPSELLRAKIAEGTAKGASQPRIADAVAVLAVRVDSVARLLAPSVTVPELHAGAEALAIGVSAPSLRTIRRAAGRHSAEPGILLVIRLVRRGVTQDQAVRAARALLDRQVAPGALLALGDDFARDVSAGIAPAEALNDRLTRLVGGGASAGAAANGADGGPGVTGATGARARP